MTLGRFVLKNILRNKRRTALTVLSIGFSLFLLILLWTVLNNLTNPPESDASVRRIVVRRSTSLVEQMPLAYGDRIKKIPHVQLVTPFQWFGGYYREEKNRFAVLAGDPTIFLQMFTELAISPEGKKAFQEDRRAAVVGRTLMKQYHWKVGDTVTLIGDIFAVNLEVHIVGEYTNPDQENAMYFRWDYLKELLNDTGSVGTFWILADSKENVAGIVDAVDIMFHNTAAETKTETEKAFQLSFVSMLGNVRLIIASIAMTVVFTMLLVTTSTMATTIRERTREVAIMKAIGFSRGRIFTLILGEGIGLAFLGWLFAFLVSFMLGHIDTNTMTGGFIPKFNPALWIFAATFGIDLGIGAVAGLIPGFQASRLTILQAMRKLE